MSRARKIKYRSKDIMKQRYHNYIIRYNRAKRALERKGIVMFAQRSDYYDFKAKYEATINDETSRVLAGEKKVIGDPTRYILEKQKFEGSYSQAKRLQEAFRMMKQTGFIDERAKTPTIDEIRSRTNMDGINNILSEQYSYLKYELGMTSGEAKRSISEEFFGSK